MGSAATPEALRLRLSTADHEELMKWVEASGPDCVARVAAALVSRPGRRGSVPRPDFPALIEMAHQRRSSPLTTTNSLARNVAAEAKAGPGNRADQDSLAKKLSRDFAKDRARWSKVAAQEECAGRRLPVASRAIANSPEEFLALARIINMLPTSIDLYDAALAEAQQREPEMVERLRRVGRERVTELLGAAIEVQMKRTGASNRSIPRGFIDLIREDLIAG